MATFTATTTLTDKEVNDYADFCGYSADSGITKQEFVTAKIQELLTKMLVQEKVNMVDAYLGAQRSAEMAQIVANTSVGVAISADPV